MGGAGGLMAFRKNLILTLQPRSVQVLKNQHTAWAQKAGSSQIIGLHVDSLLFTSKEQVQHLWPKHPLLKLHSSSFWGHGSRECHPCAFYWKDPWNPKSRKHGAYQGFKDVRTHGVKDKAAKNTSAGFSWIWFHWNLELLSHFPSNLI